jgi:hypothetical protein
MEVRGFTFLLIARQDCLPMLVLNDPISQERASRAHPIVDLPIALSDATAAGQDQRFALEGLNKFIRIQNIYPGSDPKFLSYRLIKKAIDSVKAWIESQGIPGLPTSG